MRGLAAASLVFVSVAPVFAQAAPTAAPQVPETLAEARAVIDGAPAGAERMRAMNHLVRFKTAECVAYLDELRRGGDPSTASTAVRMIGQVGVDPARQILEGILDGNDANQARMALDAISYIQPPVSSERFLVALAGNDAALRATAARALAKYAEVEVAEALVAALVHQDPGTQRAVDTSLRGLIAKAPVDRWFADHALEARSPYVRTPGFAALVRLAGRCPASGVAEALQEHVRHPDPAVRGAVADGLGALREGQGSLAGETLDVLAKLMRDRQPEVALAAIVAIGQVGPAGDALDALLRMARSRNPGLKAASVGALGGSGDDRAVTAAARAIKDRNFPVRAAAVQALGRMGTREAISGLVEGLDKNDSGRLHAEILGHLGRLTGAMPGPDHAEWDRWWSLVKDDFELPEPGSVEVARARTGGGGSSQTRDVPTYYGSEITSERVVFIVDVSGSMSARLPGEGTNEQGQPNQGPTRLEVCKAELEGVVGVLAERAFFNVIRFESRFYPWQQQITPAGQAQRGSAVNFIRALVPTGGTNIYDPLEAALLDPNVDTIYLLSDGAPGSGKFVQTDDILREVRKINAARRVAIHTISIGTQNELMRRLAEENSGDAIVR
ncbi:HEAT repeat domain-containing protein [Planctomycetota bacterium]|nr:HEAT repeat domain-containing protein [Planctomycetota bacterium]